MSALAGVAWWVAVVGTGLVAVFGLVLFITAAVMTIRDGLRMCVCGHRKAKHNEPGQGSELFLPTRCLSCPCPEFSENGHHEPDGLHVRLDGLP